MIYLAQALVIDRKQVRIPHFGIFSTYLSKPRNGRNPRTQEPMQVPAKMRLKWSASTVLKKAIETGELSEKKAAAKKEE